MRSEKTDGLIAIRLLTKEPIKEARTMKYERMPNKAVTPTESDIESIKLLLGAKRKPRTN